MAKNYRFLIIVSIVIVLIVLFAVFGYLNTENKEPRIMITPGSYDFGEIQYEKVEHTFLVKNIGAKSLEIKGISTSCGCTKGAVESETIMPGESTNLLVTFDPNLMDEEVLGDILRVVYIKSNDPEQPEIEVKITANVKKRGD